MLTDLRIFPGVPLAYALTTANVCGAITQTNILDYRTKDQEGDEHHFGAPLSSVEVFIRGEDEEMEKGVVNATGEVCLGSSSFLPYFIELDSLPTQSSLLSLFFPR